MCISKFKTTLNPNFTSPVTFLRSIFRIVLSAIQEQMTLSKMPYPLTSPTNVWDTGVRKDTKITKMGIKGSLL